MRKKLIVKKLLVGLYKPHLEYLQKAEDEGLEVSEIIRDLILKWGRETYPPTPVYAQALKQKVEIIKQSKEKETAIAEMSPEQYATEVLFGQVRGNKVAFRIGGGREIYYDLATIKNYSAENDSELAIHKSLVDRTFKYFGTQEPTESQWKDIWDGWADGQPGWEQRRELGLKDITKKDEPVEVPQKTPEELEDELLAE